MENDQQILMLYLADELPTEAHARVEQRLATDEALAAELRRLSSIEGEIRSALSHLDQSEKMLGVDAVAREIGDQLRRQIAGRTLAIEMKEPRPSRHIGRWLVPTAIAAMIAVGFGIWAEKRSNESDKQLAMVISPQSQPATEPVATEPNLALLEQSFQSDADLHSVARVDRKNDALSQDEISRYLLEVDTR